MNHTIKLITFDITGTLLKFRLEPAVIYANVAAKYGVTVDAGRMNVAFKSQWKELNQRQPHYGTCWQDWWTEFVVGTFKKAECKGATTPGTLTKVADELLTLFSGPECWEVMDGTDKLLTGLKNMKADSSGSKPPVVLGIISNFDPRLHEILRLKGIHSYFDFVVTSFEAQCSKPSPEIFKKALELASKIDPTIIPSEVLHVGDNYELDYCGAKNVGWNSILFERPGKGTAKASQEQLSDETISVQSLDDLALFFENNRKLLIKN